MRGPVEELARAIADVRLSLGPPPEVAPEDEAIEPPAEVVAQRERRAGVEHHRVDAGARAPRGRRVLRAERARPVLPILRGQVRERELEVVRTRRVPAVGHGHGLRLELPAPAGVVVVVAAALPAGAGGGRVGHHAAVGERVVLHHRRRHHVARRRGRLGERLALGDELRHRLREAHAEVLEQLVEGADRSVVELGDEADGLRARLLERVGEEDLHLRRVCRELHPGGHEIAQRPRVRGDLVDLGLRGREAGEHRLDLGDVRRHRERLEGRARSRGHARVRRPGVRHRAAARGSRPRGRRPRRRPARGGPAARRTAIADVPGAGRHQRVHAGSSEEPRSARNR